MLTKIIINHLQQKSRGLVNLTIDQAQDIISLVTNYTPTASAHALLYRYANGGKLELIRTIATTNEHINNSINIALNTGPTHGFYKYDLYNNLHQYQGSIFSINPNLFD